MDDNARLTIVRAAIDERDNTDPTKYWRAVLPANWKGPFPPHWCGAFALWAIKQGGQNTWLWGIPGITSIRGEFGFLYRLRQTGDPKPGDIAYKNKPYQHHAVVTAVDGDMVVTADGNSGSGKPTRVTIGNEHSRTFWSAFYSIERAF